MSYFELTIPEVATEQLDNLAEQLEMLGSLSITCTDQGDHPIFEPQPGTTPLWPESVVTALFNEKQAAEHALSMVQQMFDCGSASIVQVADQAWERAWMDNFHPMQFGERLWICPSWATPPESDAVTILLDPGLAFGTGTHATTSLCLQWLDKHPPQGKTVIDFGCGSGILSIAALKLDADKVFAIDIDPQAHEATESNARQNHCLADDKLIIGEQDCIDQSADIILANVLLEPLIQFKEHFLHWSQPKAIFVLSGLLTNQCDTIIHHYQPDCQVIWQDSDDEWAIVVLQKIN